MSSLANNIKTGIVTQLQTLITANKIASYIEEDLSKNVLDLDFPSFPCVVIGMPSVSSANYEYQAANRRVYQFDLLVVTKVDNLESATDIEELMDAIMNQFDNKFTLGGAADLGVEATTTPATPVSSKGKTFIVFGVTIKANVLAQLDYS